jgi:O-antigen ligase
VPLTLTNPYTLTETGTNLHISELVLIIIFLVWILRMAMSKESVELPKQFLIPAGVIIGAAFISLLAARSLAAGMQQVVRYIEIFIVFFIMVVQNFRTEKSIKQLLLMLIIGGLGASLIGLGQFITGTLTKGETRRIFGWHGGGYGALIASTILLSICALYYKDNKTLKLWAIITIPFSGLALILSQTRAWIGALIAVFAFMLLWMRRDILKKIFLTLVLVVGIVVLVVETNAFASGKVNSDQLSIFMRLNVWRAALIQYLNHPLTGIGVGNLRVVDYFSARFGRATEGLGGYVDNQYIQFFAEAGTFAGIAWIVYLWNAVGLGMRNIKNTLGTQLFPPAMGFCSSLLIFVIGSFFWVITPQHELFALLSLYVGVIYKIGDLAGQKKVDEEN